jgi:uncharacterized membrane protein
MANKEIVTVLDKNQNNVHASMVSYSAPLPPASEFEKYEKVLPGAADRIIKLAENQNKHRRFIENLVVLFDSVKSIGGLLSALVIVLLCIRNGTKLIEEGNSTQGLTSLLVPLGIIVGAFIYQEYKKGISNRE